MTMNNSMDTMKRPYVAPVLTEFSIRTTQMLADSNLELYKSSSQASTDYEALGREDCGIWND